MINIVICDDDAAYQEIIAHKIRDCIIKRFEMECNIICCSDMNELKAYIESDKIDIVFLDIMLSDENAMDWSINNINNSYTQIIFMTAFPQCAYSISETNCCYYLVKSRIDANNLTKALQRALQRTTKKDPNLTIVRLGNKNYIVNYQDILYIETFNNNIMLHIKDSNNITIYSSLKEYSDKLPPNFLRCHKSYLVNMNHIRSYEPHKFVLSSGENIPIPPKKYRNIVTLYENYLTNI